MMVRFGGGRFGCVDWLRYTVQSRSCLVVFGVLVIIVTLLFGCLFWEWVVSLERDGGFFEPWSDLHR